MALSRTTRRAVSPLPSTNSRFPLHSQPLLDADEKRANAGSGNLGLLQRAAYPSGGLRVTAGEWRLVAAVSILALFVRMFRLSQPDSVVFDEVHFGKFATKYLKTQYFVDVHPPLAKLLITMVAFFSGFDGNFDFKDIAKVYENTPYTAMRFLPALMGVGVVPLSYLTLRGLDLGTTTALLGSTFILFENGLVTQSRLILLDSPLIFFTALTVFCWIAFSNEDQDRSRAFTEKWWLWLILSGLSLGAVVSCKWVGLFTIATIGLDTIRQLWNLLGDLRVSPRLFVKHFLARALCLILLPLFFYMSMFAIHFQILQSSGDGDGFMSPAFQHTLGGRGMDSTHADISYGSEISIRHINTQGGYLHSHDHAYPGGSHQQQITLYPHRDENNVWRLIEANDEGKDTDWATEPIRHIVSGMVVRLEHVPTGKRLHSHDIRPPVSDVDFQNEVSGYGFPGFAGDANDNWAIEIDEGAKGDKESGRRLRTLNTVFRLRHTLTGCYLFSHKVKLPEWGFEQQEVTCNKNAVKDNSLWYAETNKHPRLGPNDEKVNYRNPGFFGKFWELQKVMWTTNAGLTDRHSFDSRPSTWPTLRRGINFWVKDHRQIYLLGNPFVWWLSTLSIVIYAAARALLILRQKRGYQDFNHSRLVKYDRICTFLVGGWALHYFPFFLMSRQLFLHHYFPALYFAILLSCSIFDFATQAIRPRTRLQIAAVLAIITIYNYSHFSPLIYGNVWTRSQCVNSKWVKTWDFSCNDFHESYSQYGSSKVGIPVTPPSVPVATDAKEVAQNEFAAKAEQTTAGLPAPVAPGPDIFQPPAQKEVKSYDAPAPEEATSVAAAATASSDVNADAGIQPPLPREPEDLATPEDEIVEATTAEVSSSTTSSSSSASTSSSSSSSSSSIIVSTVVEEVKKEQPAVVETNPEAKLDAPVVPVVDKGTKAEGEEDEDLERVQKDLFQEV